MPKHNFHIPVMGIGFTADSPIKVAPLGISSVVSLVDDILLEKLRKFYSEKLDMPFQDISSKVEDFRARRITAYLNLVNDSVKREFEKIKTNVLEKESALEKYIDLLPDADSIKAKFDQWISEERIEEIQNWVQKNLKPGSIDVNIMTKLDKTNFEGDKALDTKYNDAHAALRGFAQSDVEGAIVFSAGMNPRLYSYCEQFEDFYPTVDQTPKKRIILKVSDYRSALIQGKFLAKKGLWISEYRIESGLNCGGHAFATDGLLMGPILKEFHNNKKALMEELWELYVPALEAKERPLPKQMLGVSISVQGGVGTAEEHNFLIENYDVDSVGWGSPFLLVPEATTLDNDTIKLLEKADESQLYLSNISPLGVPFNTVKGNTKDVEKEALIAMGKPGSDCPKRYIALNQEYGEKGLCTASAKFQRRKIKELKAQHLSEEAYTEEYNKITEKSCLCVGLGTAALVSNNLDTSVEGPGISVCPGPNMAYFDHRLSLKDMVGHIYGKLNVMHREDRPHMFVKELSLYIKHLSHQCMGFVASADKKRKIQLTKYVRNMESGIQYYKDLFSDAIAKREEKYQTIYHNALAQLDEYAAELNKLKERISEKELVSA